MKITVAQLNYQIGDFEGNYSKIYSVIEKHHNNTDIIVFSELSLCGYYPDDLLERPEFIQQHDLYLSKIITQTKKFSCAIILGVITKNMGVGKPLYNSLVMINEGKIIYTYHKKLLPVYNIFDEARHFEPGSDISNQGIFLFNNIMLGFLICEDGWATHRHLAYPTNPAENFENANLDLIIAINGSPSNIGKHTDRVNTFGLIAQKTGAPILFCNQVGGNDDIVFDGGSFVLDKNGKPLANLPYFQACTGQVTLEKSIHSFSYSTPFQAYHSLPEIELIYQQILLGLIDYTNKCHFDGVVIGLSGGMDSALTLTLAVIALGPDKVKAIFMPTRYTALQSQEDSEKLCQNLNIEIFNINIDEEFEFSLNQFKNAFKQEPNKITKQNIQARLRGRILMEYSNQTGFLVLSTGNKSELSCGYTTLYGDMTGGLNLIGDLYKTDVYCLANYINMLPKTLNIIPETIIMRPPTAELDYDQKDSDDLLPYPELDAILKLYIEGDLLNQTEISALEKIVEKVPKELVLKVKRLVDKAEFKRRQSAPIIRVQKRAFGQGRRIPISMFIK